MRNGSQYSLMSQKKTCTYYLTLIVISIITLSCNGYHLEDYNPDRFPSISKSHLAEISDTSATKERLSQYSAGQQVDSLLYFAEWQRNKNDEIAIRYAQMAYDIATEKNWNFPRAISAYRIASLRGYKAQYGEDIEIAMVDAKIAERLFKDYDRPDWNLRLLGLLGHLYYRMDSSQIAEAYFKEGLLQMEEIDNWDQKLKDQQKAFLTHDLVLLHPAKDTHVVHNMFAEADSLFKSAQNQKHRARLWLDWASYYVYYGDYPDADSLYNLCLNYGQLSGEEDQDLLQLAFRGKGYLYRTKFTETNDSSDFKLALSNLNQCVQISNQNDYRAYELIGNLYQDSWYDLDVEPHADSAIIYYKTALTKAKEAGAIKRLKWLGKNIVQLCEYDDGKHKPALGEPIYTFLYDNYSAITDTITNHSKLAFKRINKVEQRDIQVQAARKRQNQFYLAVAILSIASLIFLLIVQGQKNRRIQAEMDALRAQINPHFISNSLNAIESLVNFGDTKAAAKYLVHFSRLSRQILNGSRASMISLAEELKTLKHFLALEQLRFRDKLTFDIQIIDEIPANVIQVPAMILQPYAENAIWHGIKPKPEGGHVQVNIRKIDKMLVCIVEDNGIGREKSRAMRKASVLKHKSMGMQITEERLKNLGKIKGSHIDIIDLKNENGEAEGTKVIIRFPYQIKKS